MTLSSFPRPEQAKHGQPHARLPARAGCVGVERVRVRLDLLVNDDDGVGRHGGDLVPQDPQAVRVGVVVEDLAEVVDAGSWKDVI
jgi:hypothetical protein